MDFWVWVHDSCDVMILIIKPLQNIDQMKPTSSDLKVHSYHNLQPSAADLPIPIQNLLIQFDSLAYILFNVLNLIIAPMLESTVIDLELYHAFVVTFTVIH